MEITLEKIDIIRERTGLSYKEAKEALEKCDGDVVETLVFLEETKKGEKWTQNISTAGNEMIERIRELIKQGNITRIRVKKDENIIMDIPVTAGAIGTVIAPQLAALGAVVAAISKTTVEIEKPNREVINLSEIVGKKAGEAKVILEDLADDAKDIVGKRKRKGKGNDPEGQKD
jgi:DNA-binding Lrp family transcriptional regulator